MTNVTYFPVKVHGNHVPYIDFFSTRARWKNIPTIDGIQVSNKGSLRYTETKEGLWPYKSKGYRMISINGKKYKVSRLEAMAFIPNPDNKPVVNHKNGIKSCDLLENLEWATHSENTSHAINELGYINNFGKRNVNVIKDTEVVFKARSVSEAARFVGGQSTQVSRVISGKRKHYKGYQFECFL